MMFRIQGIALPCEQRQLQHRSAVKDVNEHVYRSHNGWQMACGRAILYGSMYMYIYYCNMYTCTCTCTCTTVTCTCTCTTVTCIHAHNSLMWVHATLTPMRYEVKKMCAYPSYSKLNTKSLTIVDHSIKGLGCAVWKKHLISLSLSLSLSSPLSPASIPHTTLPYHYMWKHYLESVEYIFQSVPILLMMPS